MSLQTKIDLAIRSAETQLTQLREMQAALFGGAISTGRVPRNESDNTLTSKLVRRRRRFGVVPAELSAKVEQLIRDKISLAQVVSETGLSRTSVIRIRSRMPRK